MEQLLRLGRTDAAVQLDGEDKRVFFDLYHHPHGFNRGDLRFRDDSRNEWQSLQPVSGEQVRELTQSLQVAGFMPHASHDGIFGYVTQAAVRLFQEYVRTEYLPFEADPPSWPDGVVGPDTRAHLKRWKEQSQTSRWQAATPTKDFERWIEWLATAKLHFQQQPTVQMRQLSAAPNIGDSLPPDRWTFDASQPHLIGIRRNAERPLTDGRNRDADDLFVLLLNGRSFYFSGSTDPNPSGRREAYLTEGQHRYRFNWHNIGAARRDRIYKAGRPAGAGVMVTRDVHGHNALTDENLRDGFDPAPNPTINIHWNGLGISNWSAGCQVISGAKYLNDLGKLIGCADFTARNDRERGGQRLATGPRLTMGAYTLLSDLLLCYTPQAQVTEKPIFHYTLLPESAFSQVPGIDLNPLLTSLQNK